MSYELSTMDGDHIILMTLNSDFDNVSEYPILIQLCFEMLETGPDDVVLICDAREVHFKNFTEILQSSNMARSEESMRVSKHRKLLKTYTVTNSSGMALAAKGLNSATFGFVELVVFGSLDEAVEAARAVIQGKA